MFTGIVQYLASICQVVDSNEFRTLVVEVPIELAKDLQLGASIAINGTCLTVVSVSHPSNNTALIEFNLIFETLKRTNLGAVKVGTQVNFERSLKLGDEIGGHHVSGHIDGVGLIKKKNNNRK
eukprot:TRINITY_DN1936_c0_g1_i1.p1 TRINITY_DN1936_c0_g1~~TRINITY_DN1936_c0_g1_i1.p1  ORF type:complete len:141 (+),score=36.82 TRINITY_DN1936_c0_g1_i1:55-423(+)